MWFYQRTWTQEYNFPLGFFNRVNLTSATGTTCADDERRRTLPLSQSHSFTVRREIIQLNHWTAFFSREKKNELPFTNLCHFRYVFEGFFCIPTWMLITRTKSRMIFGILGVAFHHGYVSAQEPQQSQQQQVPAVVFGDFESLPGGRGNIAEFGKALRKEFFIYFSFLCQLQFLSLFYQLLDYFHYFYLICISYLFHFSSLFVIINLTMKVRRHFRFYSQWLLYLSFTHFFCTIIMQYYIFIYFFIHFFAFFVFFAL